MLQLNEATLNYPVSLQLLATRHRRMLDFALDLRVGLPRATKKD